MMFQVQWYPGHMTRARRKIEKILGTIDIIIELRDARIPWSSGNPDIRGLLKGREHLVILTKADLADPVRTEAWISLFQEQGMKSMAIRGTSSQDGPKVIRKLEECAAGIFAKRRKKGLLDRPIRCMVLGISNVGKSTLINTLAKRKAAVTGNRPGVTKGNQWVAVSKGIELLDTPGLLWPKFTGNVGPHLALTGAVSHEVFDWEEGAHDLISLLCQKGYLKPEEAPESVLEAYGRTRGLLLKGGLLDREKAALLYIRDFQSGKLGRISLEWTEDYGH